MSAFFSFLFIFSLNQTSCRTPSSSQSEIKPTFSAAYKISLPFLSAETFPPRKADSYPAMSTSIRRPARNLLAVIASSTGGVILLPRHKTSAQQRQSNLRQRTITHDERHKLAHRVRRLGYMPQAPCSNKNCASRRLLLGISLEQKPPLRPKEITKKRKKRSPKPTQSQPCL